MNRQGLEANAPRLAAAAIGSEVGLLLAKLHAVSSATNNRALKEYGLKERSYSILTLACSGLEPTQREVADFLTLDPSQVVSLVDDLERRGLVGRTQGRLDRRAKIITSTPQGRAVLDNARTALEASEQIQLAALDAEETERLRRLLKKALWG